jgi:hypothetical protein
MTAFYGRITMFFIAACAGFMPGNGTFDAYFCVLKVSLRKERPRVRQLRRSQAKIANKQKANRY